MEDGKSCKRKQREQRIEGGGERNRADLKDFI